MKKLSIYITVLLAAALTACNEDFNEGVASHSLTDRKKLPAK